MRILKPSTQYKKDLKRIRNNPKKAAELLKVLHMLEHELEIPSTYNPHMLTGDYERMYGMSHSRGLSIDMD